MQPHDKHQSNHPNDWLAPPELQSSIVRLEPMQAEHREGLIESVNDGELWKLWFTSVPHPSDIDDFIDTALRERSLGESFAFAVRLAKTDQVIGSTRYMNIDTENRRAEIGYTWYAKSHQRTAVNTACKHLLLKHAFDDCDAIAMEFRTHRMNLRSRAAIERLGAQLDGILRSHQFSDDGLLRDTAVYSIIAAEWPTVEKNLAFRLSR